jgi:hypothetical protein
MAPAGGQSKNFFRIFRVAAHNNAGARVDFPFVLNQIKRRATKRLRILQD